MKRLIAALLAAVAVGSSGHATDTGPLADRVRSFAKAFLDTEAQARLNAPLQVDYEFRFEGNPTEMTPDLWGRALVEELLDWSNRGMWLDWKYNVLTLVKDDDGSDIASAVFKKASAPGLTTAERAPILAKAKKLYGEHPEVMMLADIQPLAMKRGLRLMVIDNGSDGLLLFAVPDDQADAWHLAQFGEALIIDAAVGTVPDPRRGGKIMKLAD